MVQKREQVVSKRTKERILKIANEQLLEPGQVVNRALDIYELLEEELKDATGWRRTVIRALLGKLDDL